MRTKLALLTLFAVIMCGNSGLRAEDRLIPDHILGSKDAPISVQEYASLTCSHCAEFYDKVMPELRIKYIDTGKVRFILHSFPLNAMDLKASALATCMPNEQYYPFVSVLYKNMDNWAFGKNNEQSLLQYATLGGLDREKAKACMENTKILDALAASRTEASKKYNVEATPTFIINDGQEKIIGSQSVAEFSAIFDRLLAAKK